MRDIRSVLVTGGAGFIGSHLVDRLLETGVSVTVIDNFDPFYSREIKENNIAAHLDDPKYTLVEEDIRNLEALNQKLKDKNFDTIVHLAAKAGVRPSVKDPVSYQEVNVMGTQNMLEIAREFGINQFVFASSSSVYGVNENLPWSEDDHVLKPISPYASTKISCELMGHVYSRLYDIRFLALRYFTVYGPRQRPDLAIHKFFRMIDRRKTIQIYGDGSSRRDYTYVDDIVDGTVSALRYNRSDYEIINLGNSKTVGILELLQSIEKVVGRDICYEHVESILGDVPQTWADVGKAQAILGYDPEKSLIEGLTDFKKWYAVMEKRNKKIK